MHSDEQHTMEVRKLTPEENARLEENQWLEAAKNHEEGRIPLEEFNPDSDYQQDRDDMLQLYKDLKVTNVYARKRLNQLIRRLRNSRTNADVLPGTKRFKSICFLLNLFKSSSANNVSATLWLIKCTAGVTFSSYSQFATAAATQTQG